MGYCGAVPPVQGECGDEEQAAVVFRGEPCGAAQVGNARPVRGQAAVGDFETQPVGCGKRQGAHDLAARGTGDGVVDRVGEQFAGAQLHVVHQFRGKPSQIAVEVRTHLPR